MALNNIGNMMKIMNAWNIFKRNHPKFPAFCNAVSKRALKEGSIMAITVTTPDGEKIRLNLFAIRCGNRMAKRLRRI